MKGFRLTLGLLAASLLAACGGGGGGNAGNPAQPASTQVTGTASKGILSNAIVTAYALSNGSKGVQIGQTRTSPNGQYSLSLTGYSGPLLLELTADSGTSMTCDAPSGCGSTAFGDAITTLPAGFNLRSALPQGGGNVSAAITPFTHLATQVAQDRSGSLNADNIGDAMAQVADLFDLPALTTTQPVDITAANLGADINAQRYAVLNAAIAELAGDVGQIDDVIGNLAAQLTANNGQLVNDSPDTGTTDLAAVLDAAQNVALDTAVSSKLDGLIVVVIAENLTAAQSAGNTPTTASGESSGNSTELDKVKAFIAQAHELAQSILQADNETVQEEVAAKLETISLLADDADEEVSKLGHALNVSHDLLLALVQNVEIGGSTDTSLSGTEASALLPELGYGAYDGVSDIGITFGDGFSVDLNKSNRLATINGPIIIQRHTLDWSGCSEWPCSPSRTPVGDPVTFTVSNLRLSYPALNTSASQFVFGIGATGSLESAKLRLDLSNSAGSGLTATYTAAGTLAAHLEGMEGDDTESSTWAHVPTKLQLQLKQAKLIAKNAPASHFSTFTGNLDLVLNQVELQLVNDLDGSVKQIVPSLLSVTGDFSSSAGDKVEASIAVDLDDDLAQQAVASPNEGYLRTGLYQQTYDSEANTVTFTPASGYSFHASNTFWIGSYDTFRIGLADYDGCIVATATYLQGGETIAGPWEQTDCYAAGTTLAQILAAELDSSRGYWSSLMWHTIIAIEGEGQYAPSIASDIATSPTAGRLAWSNEDIGQTANRFASGAFSATLKLKLGGSANLDTEVSVAGHRNSHLGGDMTITLKNNGKWLKIAATGTDYREISTLTLSNQDGASIVVSPSQLDDENESNDAIELKLNGTVYGRIHELAGALVARFSDNSFTVL